ncbi:hypothetical protein [Vallitalea maricola]|uniref:Uncharacterized protein n=1 Tax=Vallitalea maricola TaxID=3074433 RepID=A0ACB5UHN7_9FIRM|nr:hypothetical protein AN2V17_17040 [Vallitalea sp. AN17-2]
MRIVKMSGEVFGFDSIEACKAYFKSVLPWQKGNFYFAGEANKIARNKLQSGDNVLFSFNGYIIAIAKAEELLFNEDDRDNGIKIDMDTLKIFQVSISTMDLEIELSNYGFTDSIYGSQGWNILNGEIETKAMKYLKDKEWEIY